MKEELTATLRPQVARELTLLLEPIIRTDLNKRMKEERLLAASEDEEADAEDTQKIGTSSSVTSVNMALIASMNFEERRAFFQRQ